MAKERQKLITPPFRASFPHLFKASSFEGQDPKYGVTALWYPEKFNDKDKKRWSAMLKALDAASIEKFKKPRKELPSSFKKGIRNGKDKEEMDGYGEGCRFATLNSPSKPGVVDKNKEPIGPEHGNDDEIYPGCWCIATVNAFAYDKNGGKGVALGLQNIMKVKDADRFDSRTDPEDDFSDEDDSRFIDEDEEDEDDAPKKKKRPVDEDEDEDEAPRKKKKKRPVDEDYDGDSDEDEDY